jgi:hypothetical protein
VGQAAPAQLPGPDPAVSAQREPSLGERGDHTVGRAARGEGREQVTDRGLDLGIGVDDDLAGWVVDISDRQWGAQLAAGGRGFLAGRQALAITCSSTSPMVLFIPSSIRSLISPGS